MFLWNCFDTKYFHNTSWLLCWVSKGLRFWQISMTVLWSERIFVIDLEIIIKYSISKEFWYTNHFEDFLFKFLKSYCHIYMTLLPIDLIRTKWPLQVKSSKWDKKFRHSCHLSANSKNICGKKSFLPKFSFVIFKSPGVRKVWLHDPYLMTNLRWMRGDLAMRK